MLAQRFAVLVLLALAATPVAAQQGLGFSGSLQHVTVPHNDALSIPDGGAMTIELWMKPTDGGFHIFGKRSDCIPGCLTCNYQLYGAAGSGMEFNSGGCSTYAAGVPANAWTHVAIVANASGTSIFENGEPAGDSACPISGANTAAFWIGGTTECTAPFHGDLDEVRLWNIARTPAQIGADSVRIIDPATPGLVGYWRFEEAADNQSVYDSTTNALDGTLGSDAQVAGDDPTRVSSDAPAYDIVFVDGFE